MRSSSIEYIMGIRNRGRNALQRVRARLAVSLKRVTIGKAQSAALHAEQIADRNELRQLKRYEAMNRARYRRY